MKVNTMEEGEINDVAGGRSGNGRHGLRKAKKVSKPKKMVAGERVLEMPSDEELMAQFNTLRNLKKPKEIFKRWCKAE
jgi:hypothetical protein